jgi:ABC-type phosphate transport system substrate-binding protein
MRALIAFLLATFLSAPALPARAGDAAAFKVIANSSVQVASLSRAELSDLFLKRTIRWASGDLVQVAEPRETSPLYEAFCREVHHKSMNVLKAYWTRLTFAGRATPPITKANDDDLVEYVRSTPGAITYVAVGTPTPGVKEIAIK